VRIWRKRHDDGGSSVGDDTGEDSHIIDLRERLAGNKHERDAPSERGDDHAAWFRKLREPGEPAPGATEPTSPAPLDRLAAARRRATSPAQPTHGAGKQHDTTQRHDTTKVHDTTRVHDTAQVHDTARRDEIDLRTPVVRPAPRPSAAPEAPAPALAPWERSAWNDLDEQLASIQQQLHSSGLAVPTAPRAPEPEPEPEPELEPESALEPKPGPDAPAGSPRPASLRLGRRPLVLTAAVVVCLLLAVAAGLATRTGSDDGSPEPSGLTRQESSQLAGWLRANTRKGAVIGAPADLRPVLEARLRDRQVVTIGGDPDPATDLVVLPRGWQPALPGLAVASLATRTRTVDVLEPRRDAASVEAELARRVEAGRRLVESVNLRLTPRAWMMLANGKVDLTVASLLRRLLRTHTVEVSSFPRDRLATAAGASARTVNITSLDGATPTAGLIQTVRAPGARTHIGRDRGRPALVVGLPIVG
jgi:hypothetical protein